MSAALVLETVEFTRIKPAAYNPRKDLHPGDPEYEKLARSIDRWGLVEPMVWNRQTGNLVGGHQRYKVLRARGETSATVSVVDLDLTEEAALNVALNKIGGEWDMSGLSELLSTLDAGGYDATLTGFDTDELAKILGGTYAGDPDAAPDAPAVPTTGSGDLIVLGRHRLLCGDATSAEDVKVLLNGATPSLMVTDPPYGVDYDPKWRNEAAAKGSIAFAASREGAVPNDDRCDWSQAWVLFPGDVAYVWHAGRHASTVQQSLAIAGFTVRSQIVWAKPRFVISRGAYHWQHEPCWYAVRDGASAGWCGDRSQTTLWEIPLLDDVDAKVHSTQKPTEAMERPIRNHSGDVYDPFCGTGTTVIAAERQGRACYALEIDPGYCDVIVQRWEQFTGQSARRS